VQTYSFRKKGIVEIAYAAKDKSALRTNLTDGLMESFELNKRNAALLGISKIKLFEVGTVFTDKGEEIHVATNDNGTVQELSLEEFISSKQITVPDELMYQGPRLGDHLFKTWSPYPYIVRDIAIWVSDSTKLPELSDIIQAFASAHCVRPAEIFDQFTKDGRTSVAYRLVFQSHEKTLTDEEVSGVFSKLLDQLARENSFEIR